MSSGKVFLGVLAGVAVGVAIGVLFAPDMGWNTRKRISKKTEDLTEDLQDKFEEFLNSISVKEDDAEEEAFNVSEQAGYGEGMRNNKARTATA
jgi:gas vesicle protein